MMLLLLTENVFEHIKNSDSFFFFKKDMIADFLQ